MSGAKRSRKQQSRLAFNPLPSSSPATKGYHKQIQDRAAMVSLEGSAKRRKLRKTAPGDSLDDDQLDGVNDSIPTPAASLEEKARQVDMASDESDDEPVSSTQRQPGTQSKLTSRRKSRQQQKQLDFSSGRDADSFSSPIRLSSSARPQSSGRAGIFGTQSKRPVVDITSDEESEDELPSPGKLMARKRRSKKAGKAGKGSERVTRSTQQVIPIASESEDDDFAAGANQPTAIEIESDDNNDDDDVDMPTTAGTQRRKRVRRGSHSSFISLTPPRALDSDDEVEIVEQSRTRGSRRQTGDEEDSEQALVTPKRKLKRSAKVNQQEQEDLAEDLDFLDASSDVEALTRTPRTTQMIQKNARQKALEKLKRRRSGPATQPEQENDVEESEDSEEPAELQEDGDDEPHHTQPISSRLFFNEDEYDEDFLDADGDEEDPLGIPEGLPIEFTRHATSKAKELFKYAVEWMVQKKINPAFQMNDPIYDLTFRKLDDEVKGLAGSKFKSSVWTPNFTMSLNARPDIAYEPIDRDAAEHFMRDRCDACNRTNHPATFQLQFQGNPYHPETLEEVGGDESEDDADSTSNDARSARDKDNEHSRDAQGRKVPPANTSYYVGKFCFSNAQTGHALQHWKYHLNDWVETWLVRNGYDSNEKIIERNSWNTKKRMKYANKIVDLMEDQGEIKRLYTDYRKNIDEARNSKQGRYGSGSP